MVKSKLEIDDKKIKIEPNTLFEKTQDGLFVVNLNTGLYYTMTGTGEFIWLKLKQGKAPGQIVKDMARRFRIRIKKVEYDMAAHLKKIEKEKLVVCSRRCR